MSALAILALAGLVLWIRADLRQRTVVDDRVDALRVVRLATSEQARVDAETRRELAALARRPDLDSLPADRCRALFAGFLARNRKYTDAGLAAPNGAVICRGGAVPGPVRLATQPWLQRALQTRDFVAGPYRADPAAQRPTAAFVYPVVAPAGRVTSLVFASVDLHWLASVAAHAGLPPGAAVTVLDGGGTALARYPAALGRPGPSSGTDSAVRTLLAAGVDGVVRTTAPDGRGRATALSPLAGDPRTGQAYVSVEVPDGGTPSWFFGISLRALDILAIMGLLLLGAAWAGGTLVALRPATRLIRAAQRLNAGDSGARTGLPHRRTRLGRLAQALDHLAESLETRQVEASRTVRATNEMFRALTQTSPLAVITLDAKGHVTMWNAGAERIFGWAAHEVIGKPHPLLPSDRADEFQARCARVLAGETLTEKEDVRLRKDGSPIAVSGSTAPLPDADGNASGILEILSDITGRKRAEGLQHQLDTLATLYRSTQALSESLDLGQMARQIVRTCVDPFAARIAWIVRTDPDGSDHLLVHHPPDVDLPQAMVARPRMGASVSREPVIIDDLTAVPDPPAWHSEAEALGLRGVGLFPLVSRSRTFGLLGLCSDQPGFFTPERVEFFKAYAQQVAAALENARQHDDSDRRLRQLTTLREIDMAISSSLDRELTLNVFLEYVTSQLPVDAADVLVFNPATHALDYAAGRGFRTASLRHTHLRLGEGHAGRAARNRHIVSVPNLGEEPGEFDRSPFLRQEGFVALHAVPLIAKGEVKGVLELFHRSPPSPPSEWRDFLHALGTQAAIAIDHAGLFEDLQRSNVDLALAYDTTLEGWSRALDLRGRETEGHSQRVAEMTVRLARTMGVPEADLVHIRRGALLHDIGKLSTPDSILFQPGSLNDEEWEIMRRHPVHAFDMLQPIEYLRRALEIPYAHHEKWDGTGYPRGLRGEQIPLAARIFAVVDVWDALRSDRPYRPAWTEDQAREYIRGQAGTHFDPRVVEVFLAMEDALRESRLSPGHG